MLYELTNQLTYRGYFYDFETGLYYLQSRYYAPNWGRFINADKHFDTGTGLLGTNLYIYCDDNPIMKTDPTGEAGIPGSGATYTVYKAAFLVIANKKVKIYSKHTNKDADVYATLEKGTLFQALGGYGSMFAVKTCNGVDDTVLNFINKSDVLPDQTLSDGAYFVKNAETRKFMEVKDGNTANNTAVQQNTLIATASGSQGQQWNITYGSDGFYRLSPRNATGKALDITSASWAKTNNKNTKIYDYQTSGVTQQKWIIASVSNGNYRIISKESVFGANDEKCLEIGSGNKNNGKPVQTWDAQGNDAKNKKQQWSLREEELYRINIGRSSRTFTIQTKINVKDTDNVDWNADLENACTRWNNAGAGTNISRKATNGNVQMIVDNFPESSWAALVPDPDTIRVSHARRDSTAEARRAVITHEIGHLLRLRDDTALFADATLMDASRVPEPQPYDVSNVLWIYE